MARYDTTARTPKDAIGATLLQRTLILALVLYVGLGVSFLLPWTGMTIFFFAFCASYLWGYVGGVAVAVTLPFVWFVARGTLPRRGRRLRLAIQLAAVVFILTGIILRASVRFIPGYKLHMAGYWLHARIWLDPDRVRDWAAGVDAPASLAGALVAYEKWPWTLRLASIPAGRVYVDRTAGTVTIEHGSPLSGHWGVRIDPQGQQWHGEGETCWIKELEDGVWVWAAWD